VTVEKDGSTSSPDLHRAVVRNRARLTYDAVAAWLEGQGPAPERLAAVQGLADLVRLQDEAAQRLRRRRFERGALRLDRPSTHLVFDDGKVTAIREERQNRAQQLIEDFMIAANEATAQFVDGHGLPSLRRVVHTPKRWPRIVEIARQLDERLPEEPDSASLAAFLDRRRAAAPDDFPELAVTITKLLGSGEYAVDLPGQPSPGHFGLAVNDYTHSTAPNRRFPDLVTQRQIKAVLGGGSRSPYSVDELTEIASHCTEREDAAEKVERQVQKSAAALLISKRIGETFDAVVTGASEKGTWVRLFRLPVEGRLERGHQGLDVGDRLRVKLVHTDVERGFIDFEG
jgi:exoribonuclease-2